MKRLRYDFNAILTASQKNCPLEVCRSRNRKWVIVIRSLREAKSSKVRSGMKWWSRCISMTIAKTASRNVAFKVTRMREAIMENQSELLMRKLDTDEIGLEGEKQVDLDDVGINADLYIFNQVSIHD